MSETNIVVYIINFPAGVNWDKDEYCDKLVPFMNIVFPEFIFKMTLRGIRMTKDEKVFDRSNLAVVRRIEKKLNEMKSKIWAQLGFEFPNHNFKVLRIFTESFIESEKIN
jgi:hypothetical protein